MLHTKRIATRKYAPPTHCDMLKLLLPSSFPQLSRTSPCYKATARFLTSGTAFLTSIIFFSSPSTLFALLISQYDRDVIATTNDSTAVGAHCNAANAIVFVKRPQGKVPTSIIPHSHRVVMPRFYSNSAPMCALCEA
eukprot:TRINITY_DN8414_c0_g1_i1.p1 TRINITY_DN8414_c0_g1~~TRINITY_DN8414_c0_g1_i1.p1  ORF type:complete len:137 (-),score=7.02 TRINITY_DN8414_c0_g1_i1:286-696(-)